MTVPRILRIIAAAWTAAARELAAFFLPCEHTVSVLPHRRATGAVNRTPSAGGDGLSDSGGA